MTAKKTGSYEYLRDAIEAVQNARLSWARDNEVYAELGKALACLDGARRLAEAHINEESRSDTK